MINNTLNVKIISEKLLCFKHDENKEDIKDFMIKNRFDVGRIRIDERWLEKITVKRSNFDEDPEKPYLYFDPDNPIEENVKKFIEDFDPYSITNTTDLFHKEATVSISKKYNIFNINK